MKRHNMKPGVLQNDFIENAEIRSHDIKHDVQRTTVPSTDRAQKKDI